MNEIFRMTFLIELSVIAVTDIREKKISNRSVIFLCLTAAGFVLLYRKTDVMSHLLGAVCVSVPLLVTAIVVPGAFGMGTHRTFSDYCVCSLQSVYSDRLDIPNNISKKNYRKRDWQKSFA